MTDAPACIRWGPLREGRAAGYCPYCQLRLTRYWTNGAPGEFFQEQFTVNPGYLKTPDGTWQRGRRYRDFFPVPARQAARFRRALAHTPHLARYANDVRADLPPDSGAAVQPGAIVRCGRCQAQVTLGRPIASARDGA